MDKVGSELNVNASEAIKDAKASIESSLYDSPTPEPKLSKMTVICNKLNANLSTECSDYSNEQELGAEQVCRIKAATAEDRSIDVSLSVS